MDLEDIALDEYGNFVLAKDGDAATVTGADMVLQDLADELQTFKGMMEWHPEYGGRLQRYFKTESTASERNALAREVAAIMVAHPNVIPESVGVVPVVRPGGGVEMSVSLAITLDGQIIENASLMVIVGPEGVRVIAT
ncbi:hypothetical protein JCM15765_02700 [Paradesulfitobacterium aromaticivorans]